MSELDWDTPEIANDYDKNCDHQFFKGNMLVEMMGISKGNFVLDLGCGTGRQAEYISKIIGDSGYLTGVDPSSHRLALAKRRFDNISFPQVSFFQSQAEHLDFIEDSYFNHALFCSSFHWVEDKPLALAEVFRVLKPGGTIGMTTLNREKDHHGHEILNKILLSYGLPETKHGHGGMKRVTRDELFMLLQNAGFQDIQIDLKNITAFRHSPLEILNRPGNGSYQEIVKGVDESVKTEIRETFIREYNLQKENGVTNPGTLFAIAKKE